MDGRAGAGYKAVALAGQSGVLFTPDPYVSRNRSMNRRYLLKRVGQAVFTVWAVVTITFGMVRLLPGDARDLLAVMSTTGGESASLPDEAAAETAPLWEQYLAFLGNVLQGDLGRSVFYSEDVTSILADAVPFTVFVISVALVLTFAIGIALGATIAYKEGTRLDIVVSSLATFLNSVPYYIAAVLLVYVLGYQLSIFPAQGKYPDTVTEPVLTNPDFVVGVLQHATLPIVSIVVTAFGFRALAMRGNSIQILGEEYVRVADLRGLSERRIALQYVGRNAVLPMYTELMIAIGAVLGGSVVIEEIFQYKGLGFFFFRAISARDYPLMMGAFIVIALAVVIGLFIADVTYGFIDPRANSTETQEGSSGSRASLRARLFAFVAALRRFKNNVRARISGETHESPAAKRRVRREPDKASDTIFQTTSDVDVSRSERYKRAVLEYVVAPGRIIWQDARARIGAAVLLLFVLVGTVGTWLVPAPRTNQAPRRLGVLENMNHPLGSTNTGYDLLSQVVHSTPNMLEMMLAGAVFATVLATTIGILAGYSRGTVDRVLMLLSDVALTIPGLPLVMLLAVIFEPTEPWKVGLLLTANAWGGTARQIRSQVLSTGRESYVEASGIMSLSLPAIMVKDILPNIAPFVFVRFVQLARQVIVSSVALYFLGVLPFTDVGTDNWGVMLQFGYQQGALYSLDFAHWLIIPIVPIVLLTYGLILFAQGTDRIFNPRVRARHVDPPEEREGAEQAAPAAPSDD